MIILGTRPKLFLVGWSIIESSISVINVPLSWEGETLVSVRPLASYSVSLSLSVIWKRRLIIVPLLGRAVGENESSHLWNTPNSTQHMSVSRCYHRCAQHQHRCSQHDCGHCHRPPGNWFSPSLTSTGSFSQHCQWHHFVKLTSLCNPFLVWTTFFQSIIKNCSFPTECE